MKPGGPLRRGKSLQRKTALEAKTEIRRTSWIKRATTNKAKAEKDAADRAWFEDSKRIIWRRSGGQCEFRSHNGAGMVEGLPGWFHEGRCVAEAQDAHHIKRQAQGHDHSPGNLVALCRTHHRYCHNNVGAARALGYLSPAKRGDL